MNLILQCAIKILREHAEGRSVDPARLDWAIELALLNLPPDEWPMFIDHAG